MKPATHITACATTISRSSGGSMDELVFATVGRALKSGPIGLDAIDAVVTVGSDVLDGVLVPTRAEIAGSVGRSYVNLPSSSGQAISACDALIRSGQARTVLLAGWGNLAKFGEEDPRNFQADPFYTRPVGATPRALADLQASQLCDHAILSGSDIQLYGAEMLRLAWPAEDPPGSGGNGSFRCEGAVAIVLAAEPGEESGLLPVLAWQGMSTRAYVPEDHLLDPFVWTGEAAEGFPRDGAATASYHVSGPHAAAEIRAARALAGDTVDLVSERLNPGGGGAVRDFGPATGLAVFAEAATAVRTGDADCAVVADLAGPLGQMISIFSISQGLRA